MVIRFMMCSACFARVLQVDNTIDDAAALPALRARMGDTLELKETLNDIESMAYLGRYYACKMCGGAKLAAFRESQQKQFCDEAVAHLRDAVEEWKAYAAIVSQKSPTNRAYRGMTKEGIGLGASPEDVRRVYPEILEEQPINKDGFGLYIYPDLRLMVGFVDGVVDNMSIRHVPNKPPASEQDQ